MFFNEDALLIASAVIPALILLIYIYKIDKLDREPAGLLFGLLVRGIEATALACFTETIGSGILDFFLPENTVLYQFLMNFIVVGVSEEGFKYMLLKRRTWCSPDFNCQFDGVVYAVFVSLGFALWENVQYVVLYGFETALVRAVTAVPGHASFGVFMGVFYGLAKRNENYGYYERSGRCRKLALIVPVLLHGFYDFVASIEFDYSELIFLGFIALLFVSTFILVRRLSKHDEYIASNESSWM